MAKLVIFTNKGLESVLNFIHRASGKLRLVHIEKNTQMAQPYNSLKEGSS